jgi:hypothetical protein
MFLEKFDTPEQIKKKIEKVVSVLDFETFKNITRIYYEALQLSYIKLKRKSHLSKKFRFKNVTLGRSEMTSIIKLLDYFHRNDCCTPIKQYSPLAECYHSSISEDEALRYCDKFVVGIAKDKFGNEIKFTKDFFLSLYKSEGCSHIEAAQEEENFNTTRAKRLPLVRYTIENTTNIFQRIDERENLERMYVHRYIDFYNHTYFSVVIAEKNKKDKANPFLAKTAFPIFDHLPLLRRLEKYEPPLDVK